MALMLQFEWDETKRRANRIKHRIDFKDVVSAFSGPNLDDHDLDHSNGEERWRRLIWLKNQVVAVTYTITMRGEKVRLISARPANREETEIYLEYFYGETST